MFRFVLLFIFIALCKTKSLLFTVDIDVGKTICNVDKRFVSIAMGMGQAEKGWRFVDFKSTRLAMLLSKLKPAYFRFGGSKANHAFFEKPTMPDNFTITDTDFTNIYELATNAGMDFLYNLNAFDRLPNGDWDPTNTIKLLDYVSLMNYNVNWELGNEPNSYGKLFY